MSESNIVDTELLTQIKEVLSNFPEYWNGETLLRIKVTEDIRSYNEKVIESLLNNELIKNTYSITLKAGIVFKVEEFVSMLRYKNYWENGVCQHSCRIQLIKFKVLYA